MTITQALAVAFQFVNQPMSDLAIVEMAEDLAGYPESDVLAALKRCRSELKSIKFGDILDRLPHGHPGVEEAWSIVVRGMDTDCRTLVEDRTIVWTDEMREGFAAASVIEGDQVAARMTFKEVYTKAVSAARSVGRKPDWSVSLGTDRADRERAIVEGMKAGRITAAYAKRLLPEPEDQAAIEMLGAVMPKLLQGGVS